MLKYEFYYGEITNDQEMKKVFLCRGSPLESREPMEYPSGSRNSKLCRVPTAPEKPGKPGKITTVFPVLEKYWNFIILLKILENGSEPGKMNYLGKK